VLCRSHVQKLSCQVWLDRRATYVGVPFGMT
jgi:hypothetical protein